MNFGFFKYITLGFEVFNAVTTLIAMFKAPALLNAAGVQSVIDPVLQEIGSLAKVSINPVLVDQIVKDAVDTIQSIQAQKSTPTP